MLVERRELAIGREIHNYIDALPKGSLGAPSIFKEEEEEHEKAEHGGKAGQHKDAKPHSHSH